MKPSPEQIASAAFDRWIGRGGGLVCDQRDWLEANLNLLFLFNYTKHVHYKIGGNGRQFIGPNHHRRCRYCQHSSDTTFRHVSHAVPEALGNKSLISLDECDRCNILFSESFEHDFDNFTRPMRTVLRIKGKKIPSFKSDDGRGRIDFDTQNPRLVIREDAEGVIVTNDDENKRFDFALKCQPYRPIGVYQCLVKMALSIMPINELRHFDNARNWLLNPSDVFSLAASQWARCDFFFSPIVFPEPWTALYRRHFRDAELPYMLFLVGSANLVFQITVPFSPKDNHLIGKRIPVPRPDLSHQMKAPGSEWQTVDLSNREPERNQIFRTSVHYDSAHEIDEDEFNRPTKLGGLLVE